MITYIKDPNAVLDYTLDWSQWLVDDTLLTSTWVIPDGLTSPSNSNTPTQSTVWLSGGTAGVEYKVTNRVTTAAGRTDDRSIRVLVMER